MFGDSEFCWANAEQTKKSAAARDTRVRMQASQNFGLLHQLFNKQTSHVWWHTRGAVERGNVGALKEFPDGNFVTPEQGFFHGSHPVRGVMSGVILEFLHARTKPLVGIVVVVGDAWAENIQEGEARMLDALLDQLGEMFL